MWRIDASGPATTVRSSLLDPAGSRLSFTATTGAVAWTLYDVLGSTAGLVAASGATALLDAYRYDGYGQAVGSASTVTGGNPFRFRGLLDLGSDASPLYEMGARLYAPSLGTFTQLDTDPGDAADPASMNRFLYAHANPTSLVDPTGHNTYCQSHNQDLCDETMAIQHGDSAMGQKAAQRQRKAKKTTSSPTTSPTTPAVVVNSYPDASPEVKAPAAVVVAAPVVRPDVSNPTACFAAMQAGISCLEQIPEQTYVDSARFADGTLTGLWDSTVGGLVEAVANPGETAMGLLSMAAGQFTGGFIGTDPADVGAALVADIAAKASSGDPRDQGLLFGGGLGTFLAVGTGAGAVRTGLRAAGAGEAGASIVSPTVGELRAARLADAHHIVQDAAMREILGYETGAAPGIQLAGPSTAVGTEHYLATQVQRTTLIGGTYGAERQIAALALRAAGKSPAEVAQALARADAYFIERLGLTLDSPTRIPGNRRGP